MMESVHGTGEVHYMIRRCMLLGVGVRMESAQLLGRVPHKTLLSFVGYGPQRFRNFQGSHGKKICGGLLRLDRLSGLLISKSKAKSLETIQTKSSEIYSKEI